MYCYVFGVTAEVSRQIRPTLLSIGHTIVSLLNSRRKLAEISCQTTEMTKEEIPEENTTYWEPDENFDTNTAVSKRYQWLPAEVYISYIF